MPKIIVNGDTFDRLTYSYDRRYDKTAVHGWSTYPASSVLAGQPQKVFIDFFDDAEAALAKYPSATPSNRLAEPTVSLAHLPGEDDPVPGGAYPDDIEDGQ
jgi:hypothetical protein